MADCPGSCWFCDYAKGCIPRFHEIPDGHAKLQARLRRKRDPECSTARILAEDIVDQYFGFQPTGRQVDVEITNMTTGKKLQLYGIDEMFVLTSDFMNGVKEIYGFGNGCSYYLRNHRSGNGKVRVAVPAAFQVPVPEEN